ncbi:hypothetical protein [Streptomyces albipurpureus]|uniref:Uncharacterized protein n=1 Tax=Streptomyces albipurpureus TaxID=2897419 RepID=A0ABT0UJG0_9ACTN|nr:hypothetical protein [Streptomyces sp. CWNU-1]MCM2388767.1 hypothetical protein [Streptomyces sp. CWNU-1]
MSSARTGVFVVTRGDIERVIIARLGKTGGGGLTKKGDTTAVDIVPASSRAQAKADHSLDLPTSADRGISLIATDTGFLVGASDDGVTSDATVIDPATGAKKSVKTQTATVPKCGRVSCTVGSSPAFVTEAGVVTAFRQTKDCDQWGNGGTPCTTGFQVGDKWVSTSAAPDGMYTGIPIAAAGRYLIAAWNQTDFQTDRPVLGDRKTLFAVHDLHSGKSLAAVSCSSAEELTLQPGSAQTSTRIAPNGRYLISGQTAFDLSSGTGRCYTSTQTRKGVDLTAVDDTGTAYGLIHNSGGTDASKLYGRLPIVQDGTDSTPRQGARVALSTGAVEALEASAEVPVYLDASLGLFRSRDVLAAYTRK